MDEIRDIARRRRMTVSEWVRRAWARCIGIGLALAIASVGTGCRLTTPLEAPPDDGNTADLAAPTSLGHTMPTAESFGMSTAELPDSMTGFATPDPDSQEAYGLIDEALLMTLGPGPTIALVDRPGGASDLLAVVDGSRLVIRDRASLELVGDVDLGFPVAAIAADGPLVAVAPSALTVAEDESGERSRIVLLRVDDNGAPSIVSRVAFEIAGQSASIEALHLNDGELHVAEQHMEPTAEADPWEVRGPPGAWDRIGQHKVSVLDPANPVGIQRLDLGGEHVVLSTGPDGPLHWGSSHRGFDAGRMRPIEAMFSESPEVEISFGMIEGVLHAAGGATSAWAVQQRREYPAVLRGVVWDAVDGPRIASQLAFPRAPDASGARPAVVVPTRIALDGDIALIGVVVGHLKSDVHEELGPLLDLEGRVQLVDVRDPARPAWRGRLTMREPIVDLVAADGVAWLRFADGAIARVDMSDPDRPVVVGGEASERFDALVGSAIVDPPDPAGERAYMRWHTRWHESIEHPLFVVHPEEWRAEDGPDGVRLEADRWPGSAIEVRVLDPGDVNHGIALDELKSATVIRDQSPGDLDTIYDMVSYPIHRFETSAGGSTSLRALIPIGERIVEVTLPIPDESPAPDELRMVFDVVVDGVVAHARPTENSPSP